MATRLLNDWIDNYMRFVDNSEPPLLFKKWCALSTIAACLQRKCKLNWGYLTFYPNLYVVLVAPSGKCRKGTAMKPCVQMLTKLGIKVAAEAITREALIRELGNCEAMTGDQNGGVIITHSSLTVLSPELTVFLGYNNLTLMADLTDWYDCADTWTYRTKNCGENKINGVWVNLLGATTPELIQSTLPRDAIGGGLTSRIIFVYEDKKAKIVPAPFLTPAEEQLGEALRRDLEIINMMTGDFRVSEDFIELWSQWYLSQEDNPPFKSVQFGGYFERRPNHVLKLSMIMNASRTNSMIMEASDLQRAIDTLKETEVKMPRTFGGFGRNSTADVVHKIMQMLAVKQKLDCADLMRQFYHDVDQPTFDGIVKTLQGMQYCRVEITGDRKELVYIGGLQDGSDDKQR